MPKLPTVSGIKVVKALAKVGYALDHQTGSHLILRHKEEPHSFFDIINQSGLLREVL